MRSTHADDPNGFASKRHNRCPKAQSNPPDDGNPWFPFKRKRYFDTFWIAPQRLYFFKINSPVQVGLRSIRFLRIEFKFHATNLVQSRFL